MNFLHIWQGQLFGLQGFNVCLKIFKLSAFLKSASKSFQRIAPITLTFSKPSLLVLMFRLFTVTPNLRLQELFSLKLKIHNERRRTHSLYIFPLANIFYFFNGKKPIYQDLIVHWKINVCLDLVLLRPFRADYWFDCLVVWYGTSTLMSNNWIAKL